MLRVAVRHATLGHPEVRIGAIAGFGGTTRLPRLIGKGRAAELLLAGRLVSAEEALQIDFALPLLHLIDRLDRPMIRRCRVSVVALGNTGSNCSGMLV